MKNIRKIKNDESLATVHTHTHTHTHTQVLLNKIKKTIVNIYNKKIGILYLYIDTG